MTAAVGLVRTSLGDSDPYLAPALLVVCGLAAALVAWRNRRGGARPARRILVGGLAALAVFAFVVAGVDLADSAGQIRGIGWEGDHQVLVLERMGPLGPIRIPRADVASIGTLPAREHSLTGSRPAVLFVIHTRSGASYWSAPVRSREQVDRAQETLAQAKDRRQPASPGVVPQTD